MYVSSSMPIPQTSTSPLPAAKSARYNLRKQITELSVARAASNYACATPASAFSDFGRNFQQQVVRSVNLLNRLNVGITTQSAQAGASSTGTSGAPTVVPLNPVNTTPKAKPEPPAVGSWDAPAWGNAATAWTPICTPGQTLIAALQNNPGWALGGLVAILLAGGVIGTGVKRRRARRRAA